MLRRKELKTSARLQRKTRLKARRDRPRRGPPRDAAHLEFVRGLACVAGSVVIPGLMPHSICGGRVQAHHAGVAGLGQQGSDYETVPLCAIHHRHWHDGSGAFRGLSRVGREQVRLIWLAYVSGRVAWKKLKDTASTMVYLADPVRAR